MGNGNSVNRKPGIATLSALALTTAVAAVSTPVAAQSSGVSELTEIVVTARKREESLQEVPIAITA
ncbi:MAG: hypothetical protein EB021_05015, partial [Gammaproteobacteria bacterium]|nr:hypothetical protein [Gammaproteobacteria bacterium]